MKRILGVHDEFVAATIALTLLEEKMNADPSYLSGKDLSGRVARNLRDNLEMTYLVRLFAEFEAGLRDVWQKCWRRDTEPAAKVLLDMTGNRRAVPFDWIQQAHRVRGYRNDIVHEGESNAGPIPIADALKHLTRFFGRMPGQW